MKITAKKEYSISDLISKSGIFSDGDWIESKDQDPNGEVRLIQLADIGDGVFIDKSKRFLTLKRAQELKCTFLKKGDILIARMPDPIGRACIFPGSEQPCVTAVDVGIIRPENNAVHNEWLKYKINSPHFRHLIREYTTGTTRKRISRKNLDKITFELPSYADQIKIVQILSKAEQLIKDRKQTIRYLDALLQSQFLKMFGDPLVNPYKWKGKTLPELAKKNKYAIKRGPFGGSLKKEIFVDSGFLVYEQFHAINDDFSLARYFITHEKYQELIAFKVIPRDLIISCSGVTLGRIAEIPEGAHEGIINQALLKLSLNPKEINNTYFKFLFRNKRIQDILFGFSRGSGIPNFPPMKTINSIKFPTPPIKLQNEFSKFIERTDFLKAKLESSLNDIENLFNTISQLAFKGKLDLSEIDGEQQELKQIKSATNYFAQQTKLLAKLAPLAILQKKLDRINKSTQTFKSFEAVNKAFEVNKLPHIESLKRFEEFMVNSGIGRLDEINSYQEYLDVMNLPVFKQLDIADKFRIKGLEHFHERYLKELKELERKRRKEEAKSYHGKKLDEEFLITILKKDFKGPFKAEILYEHLKQLSFDFNYDHFVNLIFGLLKGKKPILKQKCIETHIHEMAIPIMDLLPELQEAQKSDGLYLMLNKE